MHIREVKAIAEIDFLALFAGDLPNGLKAGTKLELKGTSEFLSRTVLYGQSLMKAERASHNGET